MQRTFHIVIVAMLFPSQSWADRPVYERLNAGNARVLYAPSSMYSDEEIDFAMDRSGFYGSWTLPGYDEEDILDLTWRSSAWPVGYGRSTTTLPTPDEGRSRTLFIRQEFTIPAGPDQPLIINLPSPSSTIWSFFNLNGVLYIDGEEHYRSRCCQDENNIFVSDPGYLDQPLRADRNEEAFLTMLTPGQHTLAVSSHTGNPSPRNYANVELYRPVNTRIWSGANGTNWEDDGNWHFGQPLADNVAVFWENTGESVNLSSDVTLAGMTFHRGPDRTVSGPGTITLQGTEVADIEAATHWQTTVNNNLELVSPLDVRVWDTLQLSGDLNTNGNSIRVLFGTLVFNGRTTGQATLHVDQSGSNVRAINNGLFEGNVLVDYGSLTPTFENHGQVTGTVDLQPETRLLNQGTLRGNVTSIEAVIDGEGQIVGNIDLTAKSLLHGNMTVSGHVRSENSIVDPGDITDDRDFRQMNAGAINVSGSLQGDVEIDLFRADVFDSLTGSGDRLELGSLQINVPAPFLPPDGSEFAILTGWGEIQVEDIQLPDVSPAAWDTSRLLSEGVLVFANDEGVSSPFGCDFNEDTVCDLADLGNLTVVVAQGVNDLKFDMDKDRIVDHEDVDEWLQVAAMRNGFASSYLYGDANLDGVVNSSDLMSLGINWQQMDRQGWFHADFNSDGRTDAQDLNSIGRNWQSSVPRASPVPEPALVLLQLPAILFLISLARRHGAGKVMVTVVVGCFGLLSFWH